MITDPRLIALDAKISRTESELLKQQIIAIDALRTQLRASDEQVAILASENEWLMSLFGSKKEMLAKQARAMRQLLAKMAKRCHTDGDSCFCDPCLADDLLRKLGDPA